MTNLVHPEILNSFKSRGNSGRVVNLEHPDKLSFRKNGAKFGIVVNPEHPERSSPFNLILGGKFGKVVKLEHPERSSSVAPTRISFSKPSGISPSTIWSLLILKTIASFLNIFIFYFF